MLYVRHQTVSWHDSDEHRADPERCSSVAFRNTPSYNCRRELFGFILDHLGGINLWQRRFAMECGKVRLGAGLVYEPLTRYATQ